MYHWKKTLIEEMVLAFKLFDQRGSFTIRKKKILELHAKSKNEFEKWWDVQSQICSRVLLVLSMASSTASFKNFLISGCFI